MRKKWKWNHKNITTIKERILADIRKTFEWEQKDYKLQLNQCR